MAIPLLVKDRQQVVEEAGSYGEEFGFVDSFCGIVNPFRILT